MATIELNRNLWDRDYKWLDHGEEWSRGWGGSDMQWFGSVLPRIKNFLPATNILEIAPGHGRWTQFLLKHCALLSIVDLSESCIKICEQRFASYSHLKYFTNDGKNLEMIDDNSIDLAFSFDSLVHAEDDVIDSYLASLSKKLKLTGVGFIHHSNIKEYSSYFDVVRRIPKGAGVLSKLGIIENNEHLRARSMSAKVFDQLCEKHKLKCISQELINWSSTRLIDCLSIFCREDSPWVRQKVVLRNSGFMNEMRYLNRLSSVYRFTNQETMKE